MLASQWMQIAVSIAPKRAARLIAKRKFAHLSKDANNFTHPDDLAQIAAPYRMVSFDLFDTLVWRKIALEDVHRKTAEFADTALTGDDGPLPRGLLLHARGAHQEAVKRAGMASKTAYRNEVDLAEVFASALAPYIGDARARARAVEALIAYEIETERRALVVDPAMRDFARALRAQGKTVILVSDMYFCEAWLRRLLADLDLLDLFDHIFVSASVGVTKHSGLLFDHVDETLGSRDWPRLHLGDNWTNDVAQPRAHGWDALHYFNRRNEERKDALERLARHRVHARRGAARGFLRAVENGPQASHGGQTDRLTRLVAANFLGFAHEVWAEAVRGRYDRVLFLTRDGTIFRPLLEEAARQSGAAAHLDLPTMGELALSRRSGALLALPAPDDPEWEGYLRDQTQWLQGEAASLTQVMRAFALTAQDLPQMHGQGAEDMTLEAAMATPALKSALAAALAAKQDRAALYLEQQGVFQPDLRILLVDIGYSGTVLKSLSAHIHARERAEQGADQGASARLSLMIFAGNRYYAGNLDRMHPRAQMLPPAVIDQSTWRARALSLNFAWLEPFAVDRRRGSLRDYAPQESGALAPVFAPPNAHEEAADAEVILDQAREIGALMRLSPLPQKGARAALAEALVARFGAPTRADVARLGALTHHAGLSEVVESGLIGRLRLWRLRRDLTRLMAEDRWIQGSLAASRLGLLTPLFNRMIGLITR
ncbi:HAD family hydrolase [Litorivita sp. NS0012-18]|uniref:HAD family hydrolase n=1 Tax=Litorivita sp. NS0012-18 TaxID=3127655 RepID=UPI0031053E39